MSAAGEVGLAPITIVSVLPAPTAMLIVPASGSSALVIEVNMALEVTVALPAVTVELNVVPPPAAVIAAASPESVL